MRNFSVNILTFLYSTVVQTQENITYLYKNHSLIRMSLNLKVNTLVYLIFCSKNNVKQHGCPGKVNGKKRVGFRYRTTKPHKQPIYQTKYIVLPLLLEF